MVGAGGIGCELLKNLVLMGFGDIHVVDLDTIDLSNLNRQFLFRHEHIKQPKALVAKETALKFNPNVKIESYHANIMESRFDEEWFKSFTLVFNALDNMDARRYVNDKCISFGIPLVESGTTGFTGQAEVIKKGATECYDCYEKETPKSFPICTIRSTPSQPIHCIVWAKSYLFTELFGASAEDTAELDYAATGENAEELKKLKEETQALQKIRSAMLSNPEEFPKMIFNKVFKDDIIQISSLSDKWKGGKGPQHLDYDKVLAATESLKGAELASNDQTVWDKSQSFAVFLDSLLRLTHRAVKLPTGSQLDFDKDDVDTLDFVASAANLRSYIFGIEPKSKFNIKQMAGNIIPAIATTNAIIAGACVLQAFKVLRSSYTGPHMFLTTKSADRLMNSYETNPNPTCAVCSVARTSIVVPQATTLGPVVEAVEGLGYEEYSLYSADHLLYEPDDEDLEENLTTAIGKLGIADKGIIRIEGDDKVDLLMTVQLSDGEKVVITPVDIPSKRKTIEVVSNGHANGVVNGTKRKAEDELDKPEAKKVQIGGGSDGDDELLILNELNGAIFID